MNRDKLTPLGYEALVPTSAKSLTVPAGAAYCLFRTEVADCRWRDDGSAATGTAGMLQMLEDEPLFYSGDLSKLSFFEDAGGALVKVLYYK